MKNNIDQVHISITFTWDREESRRLFDAYRSYYTDIRIGGPAFKSKCDNFSAGRYVKPGVTFTTRGCNFDCKWCMVPAIEGKFREINIERGNIIQDNNFLLSNRRHFDKVIQMLKKEKAICFKGGIDTRLLKDWHVEEFRSIKTREIWFALDTMERSKYFQAACTKLLKAGFKRDNIRTYVLAGHNEPIQKSRERLEFAYNCGSLPYISPYREGNSRHCIGNLSVDDYLFVRQWKRPAIFKAIMKKGGADERPGLERKTKE